MEKGVTPDGDLKKNGCDSSHEEENIDDSSVKLQSVRNANFNNKISIKEHDKTNGEKTLKHALQQQAKRRRKNTTIASANPNSLPRIIVEPLPPPNLT
ncbi:hypothetical protein JTB14_013213 [Gonioctena quinquepunctata]|nr:hypothetical protein JTB14_013213 [Gonioctena quinquepunctata]